MMFEVDWETMRTRLITLQPGIVFFSENDERLVVYREVGGFKVRSVILKETDFVEEDGGTRAVLLNGEFLIRVKDSLNEAKAVRVSEFDDKKISIRLVPEVL